MEKWKKPKKKSKRKLPRILVEWFCSECDQVHRISFPYRFGVNIKIKWGDRDKIKKLVIGYKTTLSQLNDFLNSLFSDRFHAIKYVKISYPKSLLKKLKKNVELAQKHGKLFELL